MEYVAPRRARHLVVEPARRCGHCKKTVDANTMLLPCGHYFCQPCLERHTAESGRTCALPCSEATQCATRFTVVQPVDVECEPRPKVCPPFVIDPYTPIVSPLGLGDVPRPPDVKKIMGMALLDRSLFVVSGGRCMYEYDVSDLEMIGGPQSHPIAELKWPRGIASSGLLQALYITDWTELFGGSVWKWSRQGGSTTRVTLNVQPFGVSVTEQRDEANGGGTAKILVVCATPTFGSEQQIIEYRDEGHGLQRMRVLTLPSSFQIPRHAVLTNDGGYLVCHGWTSWRRHRVSKMRLEELELQKLTEVAAYGTSAGNKVQQLRCPLSLCLDGDGLVLVVDYYNHRIQLLTQHLQLVRHLITGDHVKYPRQVCLDSMRGVLFVGLESGEVRLFRVFD